MSQTDWDYLFDPVFYAVVRATVLHELHDQRAIRRRVEFDLLAERKATGA